MSSALIVGQVFAVAAIVIATLAVVFFYSLISASNKNRKRSHANERSLYYTLLPIFDNKQDPID